MLPLTALLGQEKKRARFAAFSQQAGPQRGAAAYPVASSLLGSSSTRVLLLLIPFPDVHMLRPKNECGTEEEGEGGA